MKINLLIILSILCLWLHPCFLLAGETVDAPDEPVEIEQQNDSGIPPVVDQTKDEQENIVGMIEPESMSEEVGSVPEEFEDYSGSNGNHGVVSDPLEPMNRLFFIFNDKLYYWFYKPVASVYNIIIPEPVRVGINNFFTNVFFPVRFVNSLLQIKFAGAGREMGRFIINSTIGLAGFIDVAEKGFGIKESDEDFGQTLAFYGLGQGVYIDWPFLGPSSVTDTVGLAGDFFLDPAFYVLSFKSGTAEKSIKTFNEQSLALEDYENLKNSALDPYVAVRDAYIQYRHNKIEK